jgi:hypothetical protein
MKASDATTIILNRHVAELFGFNMIMPLPVSGLNSEYTIAKYYHSQSANNHSNFVDLAGFGGPGRVIDPRQVIMFLSRGGAGNAEKLLFLLQERLQS